MTQMLMPSPSVIVGVKQRRGKRAEPRRVTTRGRSDARGGEDGGGRREEDGREEIHGREREGERENSLGIRGESEK